MKARITVTKSDLDIVISFSVLIAFSGNLLELKKCLELHPQQKLLEQTLLTSANIGLQLIQLLLHPEVSYTTLLFVVKALLCFC